MDQKQLTLVEALELNPDLPARIRAVYGNEQPAVMDLAAMTHAANVVIRSQHLRRHSDAERAAFERLREFFRTSAASLDDVTIAKETKT